MNTIDAAVGLSGQYPPAGHPMPSGVGEVDPTGHKYPGAQGLQTMEKPAEYVPTGHNDGGAPEGTEPHTRERGAMRIVM